MRNYNDFEEKFIKVLPIAINNVKSKLDLEEIIASISDSNEIYDNGGRSGGMVRVRTNGNVPINHNLPNQNNFFDNVINNQASSFIVVVLCILILVIILSILTFSILKYLG